MKTIFLAGDSTCAEKESYVFPETGWGQKIADYLASDVTVSNRAINGRSTKSFIAEGRLAEIENDMGPGDYLFIQFGHNDAKEDDLSRYTLPFGSYQENLRTFVRTARAKGAEPVFLTSIYRRHFHEGRLENLCHGDYPRAMKELGHEMKVSLIDMTELTEQWLTDMGELASREYFLILGPGENENYPDGIEDNTHLSVKGAEKIASLIGDALGKMEKLSSLTKA